jgi:hypothetical protein
LPFKARGPSGVKEQEEGENGKKLKGIRPWGFIALIGVLGRKGEPEEVRRRGRDHGGAWPNRGKGGVRDRRKG